MDRNNTETTGWPFYSSYSGLTASFEARTDASPPSSSDATPGRLRRGHSLNLPCLPMGLAENSFLRSATTGDFRDRSKTKNPKKTLASNGRQELPICYDFVQGKCRRLNCRYQHDFGAVIRHNARESRVCFDHLRGECTRGSLCRFSHDIQRLVLQGMHEASYSSFMEPTANGICYDFCRGACPRQGKCPWTHNLVEIAWNTAKQPLPDYEKIVICRKVLNVIRNACPQSLADSAIERMISQPSLQWKILSFNFAEKTTHPAATAPSTSLPTATSPDSFTLRDHSFLLGPNMRECVTWEDNMETKFEGDKHFREGGGVDFDSWTGA